MPELPEVEHARRWLARRVTGARLTALRVEDGAALRTRPSTTTADRVDDPSAVAAALAGRALGAPIRHGKRLGLPIGERGGLLFHLGMTGRFVERDEPPRHGRLALLIEGRPGLWFDDPRRFGCAVPVDDLAAALSVGLGPDALDAPLDGAALAAALAGASAVKAALLDQRRLAGVGNIQAIEALWDAGVHPASPADALDPAAWQRLATAIARTLDRTLALAGDGEMVYLSQDASQNPFRVYGKAAAPCPRCGAAIVREKLLGRTTFLCPTCQPLAVGGARRPSR